jgi:SPX domain protein involved in polyphosphate accumulation
MNEKDLKEHAREVAAIANPKSMLKELDKAAHEVKHRRKRTVLEPEVKPVVDILSLAKSKLKEKMRLKTIEDKTVVKGRFRNIESPGSQLIFSFNMDKYTMQDGEIYEVPLEVARHLNNCYYKIHENALSDADGFKQSNTVGRKIDRFAFESLVYAPDDKFGSKPRLHEVGY